MSSSTARATDVNLTPTRFEEEFRAEARAWLASHVPAPLLPSLDTAGGFERHREWERELFAAGWSVVAWPEEYGGRGLDLVSWLIFEEEYYAAGAPTRANQNGIYLLGPTLIEHGTAEQKERLLPAMARGDTIWAQGWSEPDAGSDMASIRATARRDGGDYVVNGQKTWVSRGAFADAIFLLVRTDPESTRHHGLTFMLTPLDAPGVTVRPITQLDGETGFAEVFLDDVRVPVENVVGAEGEGWSIAMATAGFERGLLLRSPGRFVAAARRLVDLYREADPETASRYRGDVAQAWLDAEAHRLYAYWTVARVEDGERIGAEASMNKIFWSELDVRIHETALGLLGERADLLADAPAAEAGGRWIAGHLFALAGPIYAGTNQIQRNIVAERVLKLPSGRR
jgi:alkylation response protein AidB-like acyl-CoA dehydrogenase